MCSILGYVAKAAIDNTICAIVDNILLLLVDFVKYGHWIIWFK